MKIAEFRGVVSSLAWNRTDLNGATRTELVKMDVKTRLQRHISEVEALLPQVAPRFAEDIQDAKNEIARARQAIADWEIKVAASHALKTPGRFAVTFEAWGLTDTRAICELEFTREEGIGFSETSIAEKLFPKDVLAVVRGNISEDRAQGNSRIKVFISITLIIAANNETHAYAFCPPRELLTKVSDAMTSMHDGGNRLELDGDWGITGVEFGFFGCCKAAPINRDNVLPLRLQSLPAVA